MNTISKLIKNEIKSNKDLNYWGTETNIKNENNIFEYVLRNKIVSQNWFDNRLKNTNIETLKELLSKIN
tara:strand:- start:2379 stop:2585 length:207 start_codon:yes stop_codon:yes gene_type:complete